jgi:CRISPR-associated endonuclease/helicase Cas3
MQPTDESTVYAHTRANFSPADWERLQTHLDEVEALAKAFGKAFNAAEWAATLGSCHDLGKGSIDFQNYLHISSQAEAQEAGIENGSPRKVDHSSFGARFVAEKVGTLKGQLLAYCIVGHHGGLPDASSSDDATQSGTLKARLDERRAIPAVFFPLPELPNLVFPWKLADREGAPFALAFFTRMLFSCLVDADRTCTEAFCNPEQAQQRGLDRPSIEQMGEHLETYLAEIQSAAEPTQVNLQRKLVLEQCRLAATLEPGFFSLQVPTGGGKTLSSLAFALSHARSKSLRRVVVVIPFTSIIEQTADVYRRALGATADRGLIEHHTNLQPRYDTRDNQLATENWDAPLIVTTNVQLLESLFAAATTPCRKLHRLAGSVIILDEAQMLPVELMAPTLQALRELVTHYGCSIVLCTATQPALEVREGFPLGIENVRPIIHNPVPLFEALRRVEVRRLEKKLSDEDLALRLAAEERVLAIVNTRSHAARLFARVRELTHNGRCFHLSTLMCGAHRRNVLKRIREQIEAGPCRVISTQLIEAGVDLDFPVVYRAEAGFDAIAQAAGRCNREGRLPDLGTTYVFEAEQPPPPGFLADTAQVARECFCHHKDPLLPEAIDAYFRHYYWKSSDLLDRHRILERTSIDQQRAQTHFQFREIEVHYKIIRDTQLPILVPFSPEAKTYLYTLLGGHVAFISQRLLQPFLVSVPERTFHSLVESGAVQNHDSGLGLLLRDDAYDEACGLHLEALGLDPRAWSA